MDSEIEFGQLEHIEPDPEVRPDRNRLFSVAACGEIDDSDLPIFVDLDVMRDMEAHARTNTDVELGGVLLGAQCIDSEGNHFVVVRESLRAEHYEATRGSFKFTHETWEQITRQREEFPNDLQLIGWYHTHPDWGVFLSGMDMFICENFFNKALDVALVIDPCRGDRGWFYWSQGDPRNKKQSMGFYLMSNRYRASELEYYSQLYSQPIPGNVDSRYATAQGDSVVQPIVNIHDQRSSVQNVAIMGILALQMLLLGMIGYRVLAPPAAPPENQLTVAEPPEQLKDEPLDPNPIYQQILAQIIERGPDSEGIVARIAELEQANADLRISLRGHAELNKNLEDELRREKKVILELNTRLTNAESAHDKLKADLATAKTQLDELKQSKGSTKPSFWSYKIAWPLVVLFVTGAVIAGVFVGFQIRRERFDDYEPPAEGDEIDS